MKKILSTLLVLLLFMSSLYALETVTLYYTNGDVTYTDTQTFYEFDVEVYIDGGTGSNVFSEGMVYIEYNTSVFGSNVFTNSKVTVTNQGPIATDGGGNYTVSFNDTYSDAFAITFTAIYPYNYSAYNADTYISNSSSSLTTLFHVKLEAAASGSSLVDWPSSITGINSLYRDHDGTNSGAGSVYDGGLSITNAVENHQVTYSDSGDPALAISLKKFAAEYNKNKVSLSWTTESETQNLGYIIKRAIIYGEDNLSPYEIVASYHEDDELRGAGTTTEQQVYSYNDNNIKPGVNYSYMLEDVDFNGTVTSHDPVSIQVPENLLFVNNDFKLGSNYPNPFNPSFTIPFELTTAMNVDISMYDITGKKVMTIADGYYEPRQYQLSVDASNLNSGIYFVRSIFGNEVFTQKMTLLK